MWEPLNTSGCKCRTEISEVEDFHPQIIQKKPLARSSTKIEMPISKQKCYEKM